ncbi:MAG: hypothetical protein MUD14_25470, partial [Hydrococcus sp. Prado102]|nr:hypothetical protein [Hydrococcus sp. Prado102]
LYCAITVTVFFAILRVGLKQPFIASFIATLCLAFTTFLWTYTRETFDGILAMTLLTTSFFCLLLYKSQKKGWLIPLAFLGLGFSSITRISMVLAIAASLGYLVLISYPSLSNCLKNCAIAILTLIPFIAWQCWYNNLRTGVFYLSPVQTDPKYAVNNALDNNIFVGLAGLLFSPGKSIFIFVPLLILSLFFLKKFFRNFPKEALFISVITVLWFLLHARLRSWYGGGGWGPRYMVTILPLMFLPFAANMKVVLQSVPLKIVTLVLGVWGLILNSASIIGHWYWRLSYARQDEMSYVWSIGRSQPLDMLKTAIRNLLLSFRLLFLPSSLKGQNLWFIKDGKFDAYGSHTVNVWANSLIFIGVPWYIIAICVLVLFYLIYFTLQNILRAGVQADAIE